MINLCQEYKYACGFIGSIVIGFIAGLVTVLAQSKVISMRLMFARAFLNALFAGSASMIWAVVPNANIWAIVGAASFLASLGTSSVERILANQLNKKL